MNENPFPDGMDVEGQAKAFGDLADRMVNGIIRDMAKQTGRTPEEQEERLGDRFAFTAVEQDPHQQQIVDYTGRST